MLRSSSVKTMKKSDQCAKAFEIKNEQKNENKFSVKIDKKPQGDEKIRVEKKIGLNNSDQLPRSVSSARSSSAQKTHVTSQNPQGEAKAFDSLSKGKQLFLIWRHFCRKRDKI